MRYSFLSIVVVLLWFADTPVISDANAQAITARVGTLGPGVDISLPIGKTLSVRAGGSFFALSHSASANDEDVNVEFDGSLRWGGLRLLSDWQPFGNALRLTGGLYLNVIEATGAGIPTEPYYLNEGLSNEKIFEPERLGRLSATVTYDSPINPYAGLGFGDALHGSRVSFLADVGVIYLGPPSVEMEGTGMISATANQDARLTKGLNSFRWLPVVSLGLAVRVGGSGQ